MWKKLPGRDAIEYLYDDGQRLVAEQDGNMRLSGWWLLHFYDRYGREALSGIAETTADELSPLLGAPAVALRSESDSALYGYSIPALPVEMTRMVKVNYYDDYGFIPYAGDSIPGDFEREREATVLQPLRVGDDAEPVVISTLPPVGLLTGSVTFNAEGEGSYLRVNYYDMRGNISESHARNHLGGMEHEFYTYSFTDKPLTVALRHSGASGDTIAQTLTYAYDHADRLSRITHRLGDGESTVISQTEYDRLGRECRRTEGSVPVDYGYDIHGWIKRIEGAGFSQELRYADGEEPRYNGNISSMLWNSGNGASRRYDYSYDLLGRLTAAGYSETRPSTPGGVLFTETPDYSTTYAYDLHGNPTRVTRMGGGREGGYRQCGEYYPRQARHHVAKLQRQPAEGGR